MYKNDQHNKTIYKLRYKTESNIEKQLSWANNSLNNFSDDKEKPTLFATYQGEIYEYIKANGSHSLCLIMENTINYQKIVLVCPLTIKKNDIYQCGYLIGKFPEISINFIFLANLHEIHFINKRKLILDENINPKPLSKMLKHNFIKLVYVYKSLLEKVLKLPFEYKDSYDS